MRCAILNEVLATFASGSLKDVSAKKNQFCKKMSRNSVIPGSPTRGLNMQWCSVAFLRSCSRWSSSALGTSSCLSASQQLIYKSLIHDFSGSGICDRRSGTTPPKRSGRTGLQEPILMMLSLSLSVLRRFQPTPMPLL